MKTQLLHLLHPVEQNIYIIQFVVVASISFFDNQILPLIDLSIHWNLEEVKIIHLYICSMKSRGTEECLIIAMLCIENIGQKRDLVTAPILDCGCSDDDDGREERGKRRAGHKTKSVNCFHLMAQLTQASFGDRGKSNFNK